MNAAGDLSRADLAEQAVIGAILLNGSAADALTDLIQAEDFACPFRRVIFERALELREQTGEVDQIALAHRLAADPVQPPQGWVAVQFHYMDCVPHSADVLYHARMVQTASIRRKLAALCAKLGARCSSDNLGEVFADAENGVLQLQARSERLGPKPIDQTMGSIYHRMAAALDGDRGPAGMNCGFPAIHALTGEWMPGNLIVLAARPSIGKTGLGMGIVQRAAAAGVRCAVFSLEMTVDALAMRMISGQSGIDSRTLIQYEVMRGQWRQVASAIGDLCKLPISVDDRAGLMPAQMRAVLTQLNTSGRVGLIMIDYLQLVEADKAMVRRDTTRQQEVGRITRALKGLAKQMGCPVLALAQCSRETEKRPDKRPQLSDLREAGDIEQDADIVMLIHRPEHYGLPQWPDGTQTGGDAEVIVAKNRNGPTGSCRIGFHRPTVSFMDEPLPQQYQPPPAPAPAARKETRKLYAD